MGTPLTLLRFVQVRVDFKENWGRVEPEQCCNVMVEATNLQRLHPTSKSYVYKMCYHLDMLWMCIHGLHCYACAGREWNLGKLG